MRIQKAEYPHIGARQYNEDACRCEILDGSRAYAIVCDGAGDCGQGRTAALVAGKHLSGARYCDLLPTREQILGWIFGNPGNQISDLCICAAGVKKEKRNTGQ